MKTEAIVKITHKRGLHLTTSSIFAQKAAEFNAAIYVSVKDNGEKSDGKRVIALLSLGAGFEAELVIEGQGADAPQAVDALVTLVKTDFGLHL